MATTENITVLFTDLVGSTELASALAPDAADDLRRGHFSALRQAIAASGGTEVKNLGDGLMVVFPAASAALGCAVTMQQAVHRDNARVARPLGLRVGLSAGEATREADDYFGDPVIEAARLCSKAHAGQILASDLVRANAGRRSSHTFSSLGALELKGLLVPVETLEVAWEPLGRDALATGRIPLPVRLASRPTIGVIGREHELATLDAAAKRVESGAGREVILVAGEPGQGKTTLVSELGRRAHEAGMTVLLGRCDEEVGAPYRPFCEALSHYAAHADEEMLKAHVAAHSGELARMVPALEKRLGELPPAQTTDADNERYLLYAAVVGLLEQASADRAVILVLDDLHWADKPSLQLLRHLVANTSPCRLLVLGTFRDAELSSAHPLTETLAGLHREPSGVSTIDLEGLDDTGVIAFMESAAGHELDDAGVGLAHELYRETDGNPFFVAEVLRNLSESGAIYQDAAGRWTTADSEGHLALPRSVRTVIGTRVSRLGEEASKVLATASVIGRDFDLALLAASTGVDEDHLIDLLEQAQHATVVTELAGSPGHYSFSHPLIQHTLYEDIGGTRRTRVHRVVGEAIERLYGAGTDERLGELARHFLFATRPTDADKAISYARRAGDAALAVLAPDDAVRWFSEALSVLGPEPGVERARCLIGLGTAQRQLGNHEYRATLLEAARLCRTLDEKSLLIDAALANNRGLVSSVGEVDADRVEVLEAALSVVESGDSARRAKLLATLAAELAFDQDVARREAVFDEAVAVARSTGDPSVLLDAFVRPIAAICVPERFGQCLALMREATELAETADDPMLAGLSHYWLAVFLVSMGELEGVDNAIASLESLRARLPPQSVWGLTNLKCWRSMMSGELDLAEQFANDAVQLASQSGQPETLSFYGAQLFVIRYFQGRLGELVPVVAQLASDTPGIPGFRAGHALAECEAGDPGRARDLLQMEARGGFALPYEANWLTGMCIWAEVSAQLVDADAASVLEERLAPFPDRIQVGGIVTLPCVAHYLGRLSVVLGDRERAAGRFAEALVIHERLNAPFHVAVTKLAWGSLLLDTDSQQAHSLIGDALDLATRYGFELVVKRARQSMSQ